LETPVNTKVLTVEVPAPLADLERRRRVMTLEGLSDVDAGRLVEQAAMEAWSTDLDAI